MFIFLFSLTCYDMQLFVFYGDHEAILNVFQ